MVLSLFFMSKKNQRRSPESQLRRSEPELILVGGGGHCKSCIDVIEIQGKYQIAGIVDRCKNKGQNVLGYEIIASDDELSGLLKPHIFFLITIGQIKHPTRRVTLFEELVKENTSFPLIISPHAYVSSHAVIGEGTIVMHGAVVNAGAVIGKNCIINTSSVVEHDAVIGNHCHISTSSVINGGAVIGNRSFVGSNTVVREYIEIGENSVIGAGLRVMQSFAPESYIRA
jgi:sugar O-acyltransferase (sialic acid O-acetyltransferase NeuD family)